MRALSTQQAGQTQLWGICSCHSLHEVSGPRLGIGGGLWGAGDPATLQFLCLPRGGGAAADLPARRRGRSRPRDPGLSRVSPCPCPPAHHTPKKITQACRVLPSLSSTWKASPCSSPSCTGAPACVKPSPPSAVTATHMGDVQ